MAETQGSGVPITEERLRQGARNAALCMAVSSGDRVLIITDEARTDIAALGAAACVERGAPAPAVLRLEDYGTRPLTTFPDAFKAAIGAARPTVTYYTARPLPGELGLRMPLLPFLARELKVRHGHMIGIDERLMCDAMCADYERVYMRTMQVYEIVRQAREIHVTSPKGTDIKATFSPALRWVPCHGRYAEQGQWGNLPEGEVYTSPATLQGTLAADVLGDYFSAKYGVLPEPLKLIVEDSQVVDIQTSDPSLGAELRHYLWDAPNGRRAGEYAIGTLEGLSGLTGNLLQDEKMPGLHVAFGNPYPEFTGANWSSTVHVDCVASECTIVVDGQTIMRDGVFTM